MKTFENLSDALNYYRDQGYTTDFNIAFDKLVCQQTGVCLLPEQFEIVKTVRFDSTEQAGEESILFLIEGKDGKMKGTLISAYGSYSDKVSEELLSKISFHNEAPGL